MKFQFSGREKIASIIVNIFAHNLGSFDQLCHVRASGGFHIDLRINQSTFLFYFKISIPKLFCELSC